MQFDANQLNINGLRSHCSIPSFDAFKPLCCFTACDNINKEELKEEIVAELKSASTHLSVVKGSGANFYAEPAFLGSSGTYINEVYIQHSNLNCPVIHNGVQRNCYKIDPYHNTFCSACMSDDLITEWNNRFFPNGYKKQ